MLTREKLNLEDLVVNENYVKLDNDTIDDYGEIIDKDTIMGVATEEEGFYRLIDGYHRYHAATGQGQYPYLVVSKRN